MATERCPACSKSVRWGQCTDPECGWTAGETTTPFVKGTVDRGYRHARKPIQPPSGPRPTGPPTERERSIGLPWLQRCRQTLAEHLPPDPTVADRLAQVVRTTTSPKARQVALEVAAQLEEARP